MFVGDFVAQRVDQVQPRTSERAHATNITSILGNLRLKKDDVQHGKTGG
jgi:hypothetical protein